MAMTIGVGLQRYVVGGALLLAALVLDSQSGARAYWCANYQTGGTNCGFSNFAQCQASLSGNGGACNQILDGAPAARPARERSQETSRPKPKPEPKAARVAPVQPSPSPAVAAPVAAPVRATAAPAPAAPPPAASGFAQARQLILDGQYDAGLAAMQALNFDDHPDIATYIGFATRKLNRIEDAKAWYERALAADPNHKLALAFYGMLRAEQGDLPGAQANLVRIGRLCGGTACNEYQALQGVIAARAR
jgi:tetratricopeptide (TPR) repeat protein